MDGGQILRPKYLPQVAIYWPPSTPTDTGQPGVGTPVEIACYWNDEGIAYVDKQGRDAQSKAIITVGQQLDEYGGILLLAYNGDSHAPDGTYLATLTDQQIANPFLNQGAWDIMKTQTSKSRFGSKTVYRVIL